MTLNSETALPAPLQRSRTLKHPGPFNPVRIQSRRCSQGRHFRLALEPGMSLFDALVQPLHARGVASASVTLLGGNFESLDYCVTQPSHSTVIEYSQPIRAGRAFMIFGNATVGRGAHGDAVVHCHAAFRDEAGDVRGGHIVTQSCRVTGSPMAVLVTALEGFELRVTFDAETNMALLQPQEVADHA